MTLDLESIYTNELSMLQWNQLRHKNRQDDSDLVFQHELQTHLKAHFFLTNYPSEIRPL